MFLGLWWSPREVKVLAYDPHRDFYREQRQAKEAAARDTAPDAAHEASDGRIATPDAATETKETAAAEDPTTGT